MLDKLFANVLSELQIKHPSSFFTQNIVKIDKHSVKGSKSSK